MPQDRVRQTPRPPSPALIDFMMRASQPTPMAAHPRAPLPPMPAMASHTPASAPDAPPRSANELLMDYLIRPSARALGGLFQALDAPPSRNYSTNLPYASPLRVLGSANALLPAAAGLVADAATGQRPTVPVVNPMAPIGEQATFAGEAERRGLPSMVRAAGTLADLFVGPEHGLQVLGAAVPVLAGGATLSQLAKSTRASRGGTLLELAKPVGSLAKGVKATRVPGVYQLRDQVVDRLAQLYRHGLQLPSASNWDAMTDELATAVGRDARVARQWGRLWGATSPNTSVPVNTSESIAAHLWALEHPNAAMSVEAAQQLQPVKITMAPSKVPNINRALADAPLSGDKVEAMSGFMVGDPRLPIDVHTLWAAGARGDKLQPELPTLRALMTKAEAVPARGGLTDTDIYLRYEQALRDALRQIEPGRNVGSTFATMWEGTRSAKGLSHQGGPLDILKRKGLLEAGAMLDRDRLRQALSQKGWTAGAIAGLLAALPSASPTEAP